VIELNQEQKPKTLWTENPTGKKNNCRRSFWRPSRSLVCRQANY
jgi:hypothetical protein